MIDVKHRELLPPAVADEFDSLVAALRRYLYTEDQDPADTLDETVQTIVENTFLTQLESVGGTLQSINFYSSTVSFTGDGDSDTVTINEVNPARSIVIPALIGDHTHTVGFGGFASATSVVFTMTSSATGGAASLANNFYVVEFAEPGAEGPGAFVNLDDLTDVQVLPNPPADGESLVYVGADSLWENIQVHLRGTRAAQPVATAVPAGTLYFVTDATELVTERSNGAAWQTYSTLAVSGTYTPTLTNVANLDASTAYQCQYSRVGAVVTVSGKVDVDPTTTLTLTQLGISLPIASNLGATEDCAGTAASVASEVGAILGDAANNRAELNFTCVGTANNAMYFTFTYEII